MVLDCVKLTITYTLKVWARCILSSPCGLVTYMEMRERIVRGEMWTLPNWYSNKRMLCASKSFTKLPFCAGLFLTIDQNTHGTPLLCFLSLTNGQTLKGEESLQAF